MAYHVVVWLDHREARIFGLARTRIARNYLCNAGIQRIHHRAGTVGDGRAWIPLAYFSRLASYLRGAREVLIVGPAQTKTDFGKYLKARCPTTFVRVFDIKTLARKSDREIVAFGRRYFRYADRLRPVQPELA